MRRLSLSLGFTLGARSGRWEGSLLLSRSIPVALDGLHYLAQQTAGQLLAPGVHYPIDRAPARYVRALDPRADHVGLERCFLPVEAGEVADQRGHRVVEQR